MPSARAHSKTRRRRMPYREFLRLEGDDAHTEWVDGEVVRMAGVTSEENQLMGFVGSVLFAFVQARGLGTVRRRPFQMKCGPDAPGRAPDAFFVRAARRRKLKKFYMDGPADLVVEISNIGTRRLDREIKYREYEAGGVREYWIIDSERRRAEFFALGPDRSYVLLPVDGGIFRSHVVEGLWLRTEWLRMPQPPLLEAMKELL